MFGYDADGKAEPMSKPSSTPLRRLSHAMAFAAFLLMCGTSSAQVTWPTLPVGFRAVTNDVTVITYEPLPAWVRRVVDEDNVELLAESLRAIPDATNSAALNQRIFYMSVSTNALKVAEWCLTNGASVGTMEISGSRRVTWVQPLGIAIRATNAPMVRLLIAAGANPAPVPLTGTARTRMSHFFTDGAGAALGFLMELSLYRWDAVIPGPPASLEVAGLVVQGGVDPFAYHNRFAPVIDDMVENNLWHLADILMTNQPVSVLRSERGTVALYFALEHRRTNAVNFLRSIPVPEK